MARTRAQRGDYNWKDATREIFGNSVGEFTNCETYVWGNAIATVYGGVVWAFDNAKIRAFGDATVIVIGDNYEYNIPEVELYDKAEVYILTGYPKVMKLGKNGKNKQFVLSEHPNAHVFRQAGSKVIQALPESLTNRELVLKRIKDNATARKANTTTTSSGSAATRKVGNTARPSRSRKATTGSGV